MHDVIQAKRERRKERTRLPFSIAWTNVFFFSSAENKKEKRKRKPCCTSSLFSTERMTESLFLFSFWNRKGKDREQNHHPLPDLSFWKAWIFFLSPLAEVIMHHLSLLFLSWRRKRKKKRTPAYTRGNHFPFSFRQKKKRKEKESSDEPSFPSPNRGGREDGFLL